LPLQNAGVGNLINNKTVLWGRVSWEVNGSIPYLGSGIFLLCSSAIWGTVFLLFIRCNVRGSLLETETNEQMILHLWWPPELWKNWFLYSIIAWSSILCYSSTQQIRAYTFPSYAWYSQICD
jgi:hypothetical protein